MGFEQSFKLGIAIGVGLFLIGIIFLGNNFNFIGGMILTGLGLILTLIFIINKYTALNQHSLKLNEGERMIKENEEENEEKIESKSENGGIKKWGSYSKGEKSLKILGSLIIFSGLIGIICWALTAPTSDPYKNIGVVGLGSFAVVLLGSFFLSDRWDLQGGEFRKALAISIISVYFYSMSFSDKIYSFNQTTTTTGAASQTVIQANIVNGLFNNLWAVVLIIVGFYFAQKMLKEGGGE